MEEKKQFQKIMEWMRQISRSMATVKDLQDLQEKLIYQMQFMERKFNLRIDALDERFDTLSEAIQSLLKAMRGLRVEQFNDRTRFQKEIQKIRQEIRELMH